MARTLRELVDAYLDENHLWSTEGRRGVENFCTLASALGYRDPMHFGQLTSKAAIGDLICMMEDNPGMVQAMIDWVQKQRSPEWIEILEEQVNGEEAEEETDGDPDEKGFEPSMADFRCTDI